MNLPAISQNFSAIAGNYDLLLCDVWGVVHNGVAAFPQACDALTRFRAEGGSVVLITNAPRPSFVVEGQLKQLHVSHDVYDGIVSSGDVTRDVIASRAGQSIFHLGPKRDIAVFDGLNARFAPADSAGYVVCTGLFDDESETPDDYRDMLGKLHERNLFMVCANPDVIVHRGEKVVYCAGALADAYGALGGEVLYAGKPHAPIYEAAMAKAPKKVTNRKRVLAIGDSVRTDLSGAQAVGIDVLFVTSGIHSDELGENPSGEALRKLFDTAGVTPEFVITRLAW